MSTTLIPVIRISAPDPCSSKAGAYLWMGYLILVSMGPLSSMGSPMTFMILPRVSGPTGILMGAPVSLTSWPRTRPSVESIAIVLTLESPRCWATSSTSLFSTPSTSRAFKMGGMSPSNWTSTTAPMTFLVNKKVLGKFGLSLAGCRWLSKRWVIFGPGFSFLRRRRQVFWLGSF
jgi:hypothetical protein